MSVANWTLSVEDFGPIKSASVTLAPFTVFSGRNNTGKSYMASLIWAVVNASELLTRPDAANVAPFAAAQELARAILRGDQSIIDTDGWNKVINWINALLDDRSVNLPNRVLACADFRSATSRVSLSAVVPELRVQWNIVAGPDGVGDKPGRPRGTGWRYLEDNQTLLITGTPDASNRHIDLSLLGTLANCLSGQYGPVIYIPAARTGLMVALKSLIAALFGSLDEEEIERRSTLPPPVRYFLADVNSATERPNQPHYAIAETLESEILNGRIIQAENGDFRFAIKGVRTPLPLHAASSLVTELAPFIVLLKSGIEGALIFEEPEAHLHLDAQRALARVLVRLINTGTPVLVTTHSDTFLQQINILMQIFGHTNHDAVAKKFGYRPDELLDPANARGYLFEASDGNTVVRELEKTPLGFVEPAMNETIAKMSHEVIAIGSC